MNKPIREILQDCIRRLETTGGDVEAVLADYPQLAAELRPHLEVWASLSSLRKAEPSPSGQMLGQHRLLNALVASKPVEGGLRAMLSLGSSMRGTIAVFLAGAAVAVAIMLLAGNVGFGSHSSTAEAGPIANCILQLDFNHDGRLDVQDVSAFKAAIQNQDLSFDFNGDGKVDVFDVEAGVQRVVTCLQQIQPPPVTTPTPAH